MRSSSLVVVLSLGLVATGLTFTQRLLGAHSTGPSAGASLSAATSAGDEAKVPQKDRSRDPGLVLLEVKEVITTSDGHLNVVLLMPRDQELLLPLFVEREEAISIAAELHAEQEDHAKSAGLVGQVASAFGSHVSAMTITEVRSASFYGTLFLTSDKGLREIAVPTPAPAGIAVAMAEGAPIYISSGLLSTAGLTHDELARMHKGAKAHDRNEEGIGGSGVVPDTGRSPGFKL